MTAVRGMSLAMFLGMVVYTVAVGQNHGWDFVSPFLSDLGAVNWSGQFNFDFGCYLIASTVWFLWRNEFTGASLAMAPLILTGGMLAFSAYLFYLTFRVDGRIDVLLIGAGRASR